MDIEQKQERKQAMSDFRPIQNPDFKKSLTRLSTKSELSQSKHPILIQSPYPPSPESSNEECSGEVMYLSYLARAVDHHHSNHTSSSHSMTGESLYEQPETMQIIYQAAIYLKKGLIRTTTDDRLMFEGFSEHFEKEKLHPQPLDTVGSDLLQNGYFLAAYSLCMGRIKQSRFLLTYLLQYFTRELSISTNRQEFQAFRQQCDQSGKIHELLDLKGEKQFTAGQSPFGKNLITPGNSEPQVIKRSQTFTPQSPSDRGSSTVKIDSQINLDFF